MTDLENASFFAKAMADLGQLLGNNRMGRAPAIPF